MIFLLKECGDNAFGVVCGLKAGAVGTKITILTGHW